jgi:hypothetical protein
MESGDPMSAGARAEAERLFRIWYTAAGAERETFEGTPEETTAMAAALTAYGNLIAHLDTHGLTGSWHDPRGERPDVEVLDDAADEQDNPDLHMAPPTVPAGWQRPRGEYRTVHFHDRIPGSRIETVGTIPLHWTPGNETVEATSDWRLVTCGECIAVNHTAPGDPRGSRTITISRAEYNAILAAAALHAADIEGEPDAGRVRRSERVGDHLSSVIRKWKEAQR